MVNYKVDIAQDINFDLTHAIRSVNILPWENLLRSPVDISIVVHEIVDSIGQSYSSEGAKLDRQQAAAINAKNIQLAAKTSRQIAIVAAGIYKN